MFNIHLHSSELSVAREDHVMSYVASESTTHLATSLDQSHGISAFSTSLRIAEGLPFSLIIR